jgi:hypothetical protein
MKRQTSARLGRLALLVAVVVAVFTAATPAPADVTASSAVWAYYSYYIEEGAECRTAASLSVGTEMPRGGREASTPATLSLFLDRFGCEEGTNYGIGTSREIPASDFQFDEHLANATLDTSFVESDRWSGARLSSRFNSSGPTPAS